jgi:FSR family fosmidomycin resistance protein-like MFS transporter
VVGVVLLTNVGRWYRAHLTLRQGAKAAAPHVSPFSRGRVIAAVAILLALTMSKNFYTSAFASYYAFFLIERFGLSTQAAQLHLFIFLGASRRRHRPGRPAGRPHRPQARPVGLDPRRPAAEPRPALRQPVLDRRAGRPDRPHPGLGLPGDPGLRQELLPGRVGMIGGCSSGSRSGRGGSGR